LVLIGVDTSKSFGVSQVIVLSSLDLSGAFAMYFHGVVAYEGRAVGCLGPGKIFLTIYFCEHLRENNEVLGYLASPSIGTKAKQFLDKQGFSWVFIEFDV
jgi:hypothetical protein